MSASAHSFSIAGPKVNTRLRRSISNTLKGSAGNLVEWYDVYVYSVFAGYFESQFFSETGSGSLQETGQVHFLASTPTSPASS